MRTLLAILFLLVPLTRPESKRDQTNTESGLAEFFQEPKLGTSWYNPNGPEPTFAMEQANGTVYTSQLGGDVFMSCKVISRIDSIGNFIVYCLGSFSFFVLCLFLPKI